MTPSKQVKAAGLESVKQFSDLSYVPLRTLNDWYANYPERFAVILAGAVAIQNEAGLEADQISVDEQLELGGTLILATGSGESRKTLSAVLRNGRTRYQVMLGTDIIELSPSLSEMIFTYNQH